MVKYCKQGHARTPNVEPGRHCRICEAERDRAWFERRYYGTTREDRIWFIKRRLYQRRWKGHERIAERAVALETERAQGWLT